MLILNSSILKKAIIIASNIS